MANRAKTVARDTIERRVVDRGAIPLDALFEPWELIDWASINESVQAGKAVHVPSASSRDAEHWEGCATRELGRLNVYVQFCYLKLDEAPTYGLWVIPRAAVAGMLTDGYERVYSD